MEEVIEKLKSRFETDELYQIDKQKIDDDYLVKKAWIKERKIAYATAYLENIEDINKKQALDIIYLILHGEL